jgi:hypothetical protein
MENVSIDAISTVINQIKSLRAQTLESSRLRLNDYSTDNALNTATVALTELVKAQAQALARKIAEGGSHEGNS